MFFLSRPTYPINKEIRTELNQSNLHVLKDLFSLSSSQYYSKLVLLGDNPDTIISQFAMQVENDAETTTHVLVKQQYFLSHMHSLSLYLQLSRRILH